MLMKRRLKAKVSDSIIVRGPITNHKKNKWEDTMLPLNGEIIFRPARIYNSSVTIPFLPI